LKTAVCSISRFCCTGAHKLVPAGIVGGEDMALRKPHHAQAANPPDTHCDLIAAGKRGVELVAAPPPSAPAIVNSH